MKVRCASFFAALWLFAALPVKALPRDARVPGGIAILPLAGSAAARPQVRFAGRPVLVERIAGRWHALVGLPLDVMPGAHEIIVDGATALTFAVTKKHYPEQQVTIRDRGKVTLSPEDATRAEREIEEIRALKLHWRWLAGADETVDVDLALPVRGAFSGRFGARRIFNGEPRSPHVGLDVAVPTGTPVGASAAGEILAVGDYFFNGKTVFIDHGHGLITMLCHLDRIDVRPGERVVRGQAVGRSGMSGRASGPHLHWSVILNGAMVAPELFVSAPAKPLRRR